MTRPVLAVAILLSVTTIIEAADAPAPAATRGTDPAAMGRGAGRGRGGMRGGGAALQRPDPLPPFYDPKLPLEKRLDDLVSRLTLEEKVSLMGMNSSSIPRLGIASYRWWNEALHGLANGTATVFPNPTGLAAAVGPDSPPRNGQGHRHRRPRATCRPRLRPRLLGAQHQSPPRPALGPRAGNLRRRPLSRRPSRRRVRHRHAGR